MLCPCSVVVDNVALTDRIDLMFDVVNEDVAVLKIAVIGDLDGQIIQNQIFLTKALVEWGVGVFEVFKTCSDL